MAASDSNPHFALFHRLPGKREPIRFVLLAIAVCAIPVLAAQAQDQRGVTPESSSPSRLSTGGYYALVIGINDYQPPLNRLNTAVNDAKSVGKLLQDDYGFQVQYLLNQDASRSKILGALNQYRNSLHEEDSLLIYYAGHGYLDRDADKAYWLPVDAESTDSTNRIIADELTTAIKVLPSRHVLIVSDSCYSGTLTRDVDDPARFGGQPAYLKRMLNTPSRSLMASGGNEPVADSGSNGHSVFANAILLALAKPPDSMFTASDIFYHSIRRQVASNSAQLPQYQIIRNSSGDDGDFVFANHQTIPRDLRAIAHDNYMKGLSLADEKRGDEALPFLAASCDDGEPKACKLAASLYLNGDSGVAVDREKGVSFLRTACEGIPDACSTLGWMYQLGDGVAQDDNQAAMLYRKACDGADPAGCAHLGWASQTGKGVAQDIPAAVALYRKGCDGGVAWSCKNLAWMLQAGQGTARDDALAAVLLRKACEARELTACASAGNAYEKGIGVPIDKEEARTLYSKGCDAGYPDACIALKNLNP